MADFRKSISRQRLELAGFFSRHSPFGTTTAAKFGFPMLISVSWVSELWKLGHTKRSGDAKQRRKPEITIFAQCLV
jgi:hypothetical protein